MKVWWCPLCLTSDDYKTKKSMIEHMKQDHNIQQMIEYLIDTHTNNSVST
jgi:predicted small metal-binding protein